MFDKLRNKFILSNIISATAIIVTAFVTIFVVTANNIPSPRILAATITWFDENSTEEIRTLLEDRIHINNAEVMADLALVLVFVGLAVEAMVFAASYYMAEKSIRPIRETYTKQKAFIANASHELKTPIAIVQANFEALSIDEQPWTGNIESNLTRANHLITDLLALAHVDSSTKKVIQKTSTNIAALITRQVRCFQPKLTAKTVEFHIPDTTNLALNISDFTQVVNILLDNAIKYSNRQIKISLTGKILTIANDSKTVPPAKLKKIFDRFYQVDKTAEGTGLGLAIAQELALRNGWTLAASSRRGLTTFRLAL